MIPVTYSNNKKNQEDDDHFVVSCDTLLIIIPVYHTVGHQTQDHKVLDSISTFRHSLGQTDRHTHTHTHTNGCSLAPDPSLSDEKYTWQQRIQGEGQRAMAVVKRWSPKAPHRSNISCPPLPLDSRIRGLPEFTRG